MRLFRDHALPLGPIVPLLGLLPLVAPLDAQTIRGRVLDVRTDVGISGAVVEARREGAVVARTSTNDEGRYEFRLEGREPGSYRLRVSALGYPPQDSDPLSVRILDVVEVDLRISPAPVLLEGITVEVSRVNLRNAATYDGLHARREVALPVGRERVIVRGDPEMRNATRVEDVLQQFFFREIPSRGGGSLRTYQTGYTGPGGCVDWYLNGLPRKEEWLVDIPIDLIEGVEYYADGRLAPSGFTGGPCPWLAVRFSVVAVWTR